MEKIRPVFVTQKAGFSGTLGRIVRCSTRMLRLSPFSGLGALDESALLAPNCREQICDIYGEVGEQAAGRGHGIWRR
jgi:hypothetical protein